ncbi:MAG: hypothetical protein KatS3mg105_5143 [Gemmatales bacterium]|nr:MAG: hypothetical protein KatS3mg105_5143 [Gemmatales bacterium]GIW97846.1 MAG: hypothetical protein KatS3mg111_1179 [Pirellulaceae bacterium]
MARRRPSDPFRVFLRDCAMRSTGRAGPRETINEAAFWFCFIVGIFGGVLTSSWWGYFIFGGIALWFCSVSRIIR